MAASSSSSILANDTEITFPVQQANRISIDNNGDVTVARNSGSIDFTFLEGGEAGVPDVSIGGQANLTKTGFTFLGGGSLTLSNRQVNNSEITGSNQSESIGLQSQKFVNSRIDLNDGADFVTMGNQGNVTRNVVVDFGDDTDIDQLNVTNFRGVRNVTVDNFGTQDKLIIEGVEYTQAQLLANDFYQTLAPNLRINFTSDPS